MALDRLISGRWAGSYQDLARVLYVIVAAVAVLLVVTAVFGVTSSGPTYELTTDPAGVALPF